MKLEVGDVVNIPLTKSIGCPYYKSILIKLCLTKQRSFAYVTDIQSNVIHLGLNSNDSGEIFALEDIKPGRIKYADFKLIKSLTEISKELKL